MLNSMTGYGQAELEIEGITYSVEIKAVNNRYYRPRVKVPENLTFLEEKIEKFLQKELVRGSVNYNLRVKSVRSRDFFELDEAMLKSYMEQISGIAKSAGINCQLVIGELLSVPGVISPVTPGEQQKDKIAEAVFKVTSIAVKKLTEMRACEGASLECELSNYCESMKVDIENISKRSPVVIEDYAARLRKRADELLSETKVHVDDETVAREVAVYAEKSDISEEIARLGSHLNQFSLCCASEEQSGRKLDFLCQEMLREANTIASKSSDIDIAHSVVSVKCWIDRLKEQVQNIE
jgi:uncharacterized protein (TIGR00255 family)